MSNAAAPTPPVNELVHGYFLTVQSELIRLETEAQKLKDVYVDQKPADSRNSKSEDQDRRETHDLSLACSASHAALLEMKKELPEIIQKFKKLELFAQKIPQQIKKKPEKK